MVYKYSIKGQCYKTFNMAIYCHSTVITTVIELCSTEWEHHRGMAVTFHGKKSYNIGPCCQGYGSWSQTPNLRMMRWVFGFGKTTYAFSVMFHLACYQQAGRVWSGGKGTVNMLALAESVYVVLPTPVSVLPSLAHQLESYKMNKDVNLIRIFI